MRRVPTQQPPPNSGEKQPRPKMNPEMWVQLSVDQHQQTSRLLEEQQHQTSILLNTMQKLQEEMERVRNDNAWLLQEHEMILKILSNKRNQGNEKPSTDREFQEGNEQRTIDHDTDRMERSQSYRSNINKNYNEAESDNVSNQKEVKRQKVELQGEFQKIKPPTFDGVEEEVVEVWLINMNKYFQVYEYNSNIKARLATYQLREKATLWWEEVKNVRSIDDQDVTWDAFQ